MKNTTTKVMAFLAVLILLNATVLQAGAPAVLGQMPAGATAVVATKPLAGLNGKIDAFAHQIGIVPPETPMDMVAVMTAQLSISMGGQINIDRTKGAGIAVMNLMAPQQSFVAYLPVVDVEKLIGSLANKESAGTNIWKVREDMCLGSAGSYLLIAPNVTALTQATAGAKGVKLTAAESQLFSQSDVAATTRLESVVPMLKGMAMAGIAGNAELQKYPNWVALLTKSLDRVCELESTGLGLLMGQQGVNLKLNFQAVAGSVLAEYMSGHDKAGLSRLAKLPSNDYIYAFSGSFDNKIFLDPIKAFLDAAMADPRFAGKLDAKDMDRAMELLKEMYVLTDGFAEALYLPSDGATAAGLIVMAVATYADAAKSLSKLTEFASVATKISEQMGYKLIFSYNKNAGKVGGLSYDELVVDFSGLPLPPKMMQSLGTVYGTGMPVFKEQVCLMSDDVVAVGLGQGCIDQAVAAAKDGPAGLDKQPGIANAAANLPSKANTYVFFDVSKYLKWYSQILQGSMQGMSQQDPQSQQQAQQITMMVNMLSMVAGQMKGSVGSSVILEDGGLKTDTFVPTELLQSGTKSVQQMIGMMMMGGMGGGQPQPQPQATSHSHSHSHRPQPQATGHRPQPQATATSHSGSDRKSGV